MMQIKTVIVIMFLFISGVVVGWQGNNYLLNTIEETEIKVWDTPLRARVGKEDTWGCSVTKWGVATCYVHFPPNLCENYEEIRK